MIKLKEPFNYKGTIIPAGRLINLPANIERVLVRNYKAEFYNQDKKLSRGKRKTQRKSS